MSKDTTISAIVRLDSELQTNSSQIRVLRKQLANLIADQDEARVVNQLKAELAAAVLKLKVVLEANSSYLKMTDELSEYNFSKRDLREMLSFHLVELKVTENEDAIETVLGLEKPILITGKLGKEQVATQRMALDPK